jgi:hypothetical protein
MKELDGALGRAGSLPEPGYFQIFSFYINTLNGKPAPIQPAGAGFGQE